MLSGHMTTIIVILVAILVGTGMVLVLRGAFASRRRNEDGPETGRRIPGGVACPACKHINSPDGTYCGRCGASLNTSDSGTGGQGDE